MASFWLLLWEFSLTIAVVISILVTIFLVTLPSAYSHFHPHEIKETDFQDKDKEDATQSGYAYFQAHKEKDRTLKAQASVQVVVLGDIGRSPRMQYHALSIASHGGKVDLIGYVDPSVDINPDVKAHRLINIIPIPVFPFGTKNRLLFLLLAPFKVAWQFQALYHALGYRTKACRWMLIQNPPSIPTLLVARIICFFRNTQLVVDWHNFGYSILALRLGPRHPLVRLSEWYEGFFARGATAHLAVTNAMCRVLKEKWSIDALPLHDRPAKHLRPLTIAQRIEFLKTRPELQGQPFDLERRSWRLIVSSTSWTPDEDFSILLDAVVQYAAERKQKRNLPRIWAVITGKGPLQSYYLAKVQQLVSEGKLDETIISTAWLTTDDYARLLGSADLGVSLHTSSSGVDLPMKVVDMFGTGLPVAGWSKFKAWPELVKEGENGRGFGSAEGLCQVLQDLFGSDDRELKRLGNGALREQERRWDDEWMPVAGKLFRLH
ncbi:mannosyltransferase [Recurvomyces mirabilis]|uniref:Chitobiosyldiphosphodolichol beta-mannosyltransferase n=1 Tax=Recurvomyces mirabilis TaxID=574656 RepID=A0AAE0TV29_9PEZI|nr:mannosyltransferase [Recurvomyces mirabilis]KAK5152417.1 mannosyltransferase [Recurvomyces mirabilis]